MWRFLKKLEIELPYDPAIPLLDIHTKETRIERDTCTLMFIAALFTIAKTWKQPRCPSADEWIRKLWYIYTIEYYSAIKKNAFESVLMRWMKLEPMAFPVVMYVCKSCTVKKAECQRIDAFELWCWRHLESPLDCKEIQPVHSEGDQPWDFFGRNDANAETPVLWPPHAKS